MSQPDTTSASTGITSAQLELIEQLSNAVAVSGDEGAVRKIVIDAVSAVADDVQVDAMGSVLVTRRSSRADAPRVMLAAHMDEIGFMLTQDDEDGLYRFELVGGIDVRQLPGKPVLVGRQQTPGVIGARPIHLTKFEERQKKIPLDQLRIDLGPSGKAKSGDRATFATRFQAAGPSMLGKALDDRLGVAALIELVRNPPEGIELLAAFTVQEEVGLRGARTAGYRLNPDLAIAVDCTPANDLPAWDDSENISYNTRLGGGPALYLADGYTLSDPRLVRHFISAAERAGIPYQIRQPGGGGTDAGAIHKVRAGIPVLSISVPGRFAHTAVMLARQEDWRNTVALLHTALTGLPAGLLSADRS